MKNNAYKIAFSTSAEIGNARSGLSVYMNELLKNIIKHDNQNEYHLFFPKNHSDLFREIISTPKDNIVIHFTSSFFNGAIANIFWHFFIYPYYLWRYKIDLVHLPEYRRTVLFSKCKKIMTVHDLIGLKTDRFDVFRSFYNKKIVFPLLNKIDHFITVSENTCRDLKECVKINEGRITTIYEGTSEKFKLRNTDKIPLEIRDKYNFPFLLYVGRIEHPNKNHVNLIKAFQILKKDKSFSKLKMVFAGKLASGSDYVLQEIKNAGLEGDIIITGYLADNVIPYLYNLALLKVYPSVYEGFGLPVLEGYASGVPVVCSRSSSLLELSCSEDMLFDCFSPIDICEKMKMFIMNSELRDKQLTLQFEFIKNFSWEKTAEKTVEIYNWVNNTKQFQSIR
jgi:glycosyltransferase involved in cell wall biosynthesis